MPNTRLDSLPYEPFVAYINQHLGRPITAEESALLPRFFLPMRLRKHRLFLEEGQICEKVGFVLKGSLKQVSVNADGKEDVFQLYLENWWIGDRDSFSNRIPSRYTIEALEDCDILFLAGNALGECLEALPFLKELWQGIAERQSHRLMRRLQNLKSLTAEQRLLDLEETYPAFFHRFPLHLIASYLGMTKETLSRIRAARAAGT